MKLQALLIVAALAAGSAIAAPNDTAKAPASTGTTASASASTSGASDAPTTKVHKKKSKKSHAVNHASAKHHHEMHAARHHHHMHASHHMNTHMMGAGPSGSATDLGAHSRQQRMDAAYADFRAHRR